MDKSLLLKDGTSPIDFILVYRNDQMIETAYIQLTTYLSYLRCVGLKLEADVLSSNHDINIIKIYAPEDILEYFADVYNFELNYKRTDLQLPNDPPPRLLATPLTRPDFEHEFYSRAEEAFSDCRPKTITRAERILIVDKILAITKFGTEKGDYGYEQLIYKNVVEDVFPLHDGVVEWPETGPISDRQMLKKYWANFGCWYKTQPLNLIEKYFGTEISFYYAWLELYTLMLVPAAALGIICVIFGVATLDSYLNQLSKEICDSKLLKCPECRYKGCLPVPLKSSCWFSYCSYIFDNHATFLYAIFMSFWATIFMELWKRRENELELRWNVKNLENDTTMRPQFEKECLLPLRGIHQEPFIPKRRKAIRYIITMASVILLLMVMMLATLGVMIYRVSIALTLAQKEGSVLVNYRKLVASGTAAFISAIFICIFKLIYGKLARFLNELECHRTQNAYDNAYIFKCYALAFTNNYAPVFYIAFFKGRFYTYPGDEKVWTSWGGLSSELCDPSGCIFDLSIQLIMIMLVKTIFSNLEQIFLPIFFYLIKAFWVKKDKTPIDNCVESDYFLRPSERYFLVDEFMDMVIQYGFVTFFVAGFPVATVLALLNNLWEMRIDANNFISHFQRPVPYRTAGLNAWFGILQATTYVGVATNGLVLAFTSQFVPREMYRFTQNYHLKGLLNWTLSEYPLSKFINYNSTQPESCFYPGSRYPPLHRKEYELSTHHWKSMAARLITLLSFEHIVFLLIGILAYAIPDVPFGVMEQIKHHERQRRTSRRKTLQIEYFKSKLI